MNLGLIVCIMLISFSTFFVFADSNEKIDLLYEKGIDAYTNQDFAQANDYFRQVIDIDPTHIDALIYNGFSLVQLDRFNMALKYFSDVLEYHPDYDLSQILEPELLLRLYFNVDGYVETIVYDSEARLVTHLFARNLQIINLQAAQDMIDSWNVIKTVNRNGQDFDLHRTVNISEVEEDEIISQSLVKMDLRDSGLEIPDVAYQLGPDLVVFRFMNPQFIVEPGDTIIYVTTVFRPAE